mgnify:CR=1 FL=1
MTNEEADRIIESQEVPDELLREIEDESRRSAVKIGEMLLSDIANKWDAYMTKYWKPPTGVILSIEYMTPIKQSLFERGDHGVGDTTVRTLWGMKVVYTNRENIIEVY